MDPRAPSLPPEFKNMEDILAGDIPIGSLINVCGVVKDQRLPRETGGVGALREYHGNLYKAYSLTCLQITSRRSRCLIFPLKMTCLDLN